jgi:hypothetical protein
MGFVVDKVASGQGAVWLPLPIIPLTAPHSSSSVTVGRYNRTNSGRRTKWTQSSHSKEAKMLPSNTRIILKDFHAVDYIQSVSQRVH